MTSKPFPGFPAKTKFTPLPQVFFSYLLPQIDNLAELKATLHVFWLLYQKRGYPKYVTCRELVEDKALMRGIGQGANSAEVLRQGLDSAVKRGTLLSLSLAREGKQEELYFLNTETDKRAIAKIERGEISLGKVFYPEETPVEERPNIFALYEQNIGMLTPMVVEELKEAERLYPPSWIEDAFKEAVSLNKRNWRYVSKILERWSSQGRDDGEHRRDLKKEADKYIKGKYGHLVGR